MKQVISNGTGSSLVVSAGNIYHPIMGHENGFSWDATEGNVENVVPANGTLSNLYVEIESGPGVGDTRTYTVRLNGADTDLSVALTGSGTQSGSDTSDSVSVSAGDVISLEMNSTGTNFSEGRVYFSMDFDGDTDNQSIYMGVTSDSHSTTSTVQYNFLMGSEDWDTVYATRSQPVTMDGTIKAFYVVLQTAPGTGGDTERYSIYKNGSQEASSIIDVVDSATSGSATGLSIDIAPGDTLAISSNEEVGSVVASIVSWGAMIEADTDGESMVLCGHDNTANSNEFWFPGAASEEGGDGTENNRDSYVSTAFTASDLRVELSSARSSGNVNYYYRVDGADGNLTCGFSSGTGCTDLVNSDSVTSLDKIALRTEETSTANGGTFKFSYKMYIAPGDGPVTAIKDPVQPQGVIPFSR